jgi:hypothetical protein
MAFGTAKKKSPKQLRDADRAKAKRSALKALRKARVAVEASGTELSEWEGGFLGSVETRVEKYGRAFGDPQKGPPGASLSVLQTQKLKEIAAKAKGKKKPGRRFGRTS